MLSAVKLTPPDVVWTLVPLDRDNTAFAPLRDSEIAPVASMSFSAPASLATVRLPALTVTVTEPLSVSRPCRASTVVRIRPFPSRKLIAPVEVSTARFVTLFAFVARATAPPAETARSLTVIAPMPVWLTPALVLSRSVNTEPTPFDRLMASLIVIAPLLASPITSRPAVIRSSSASVRPSVAGAPLASAPPRSILVLAVFCRSVTVFEFALIIAFVESMFRLSAISVLLAPVSVSVAAPVGPRLMPKPTAGSAPPPVPVSVSWAVPVVVIAAPASTRTPSFPVPVPSVAVPVREMSPTTELTLEFAPVRTTPTLPVVPAPPVPVSVIVPAPAAELVEVTAAPLVMRMPV